MTMIIDLSRVRKQIGESQLFRFEHKWETLEVGGEQIRFLTPVQVSLKCVDTGEEIVMTGTAESSYEADCYRCLESAEFDFYVKIHEEFASKYDEEYPDRRILVGDTIDILPIIEENLIMNIPLRHLCDDDCKGLCPVCGIDRNRQTCTCTVEEDVIVKKNPFAVLQDMEHDEDEEV